ncbi:phospholipid carrier-dependent glycosyltransferase [Planotetraspora phitsanulokensis]|nr:phospholipid carrier-dependent glycosyltransferase [Planotetraspora phitsanulokensis]
MGRIAAWTRRHGWFLPVFALGSALRIVTMAGYRPALWFPDSYTYVVTAMRPRPDLVRPAGYSMFLRLLEPFHSFAVVTLVQHLTGLLAGVLIYVTVWRMGGRAWVAALASVPVLLDAYQIQLEHLLVSDSLFTLLVVAAGCLVARGPAVSPRTALALGLLLAAATLTRTVGLPLIAVFGLYVLWRGLREGGWRRLPRTLGAFLLAAVVPIGAYGGWFYATYHRVGLVGSNGVFLYSRTMMFADCAVMKPPPDLAVLCDPRPPSARPSPPDYIWNPESPLARQPGITFSRANDALANRFGMLAIRSQPLDFAGSALTEFARSFTLGRPVYPDRATYESYEFPVTPPPPPDRDPAITGAAFAEQYEQGPLTVTIAEPYAGWMRAYQDVAYLPGAFLLILLLVPPAAALSRLRPRGRRGPTGDGGSLAAWAVWLTAVALLAAPAATAAFDYRYVLPATPLACLAAALAVNRALSGPRETPPEPVEMRNDQAVL